jgi:hypothetical protein
MIGERFGRLVVKELMGVKKVKGQSRKHWYCECDCGGTWEGSTSKLRQSHNPTRSCGCLQKERVIESNTTHGGCSRLKRNYLYNTWNCIKQRCYKPEVKEFKYYGAKGIELYGEWHDFIKFEAWIQSNLGERPDNYTLDRIDCLKNYEPDNVRWADYVTQNTNKSVVKKIAQFDREGTLISVFKSIAEASRLTGFNEVYIGYAVRGRRTEYKRFLWASYSDIALLAQ